MTFLVLLRSGPADTYSDTYSDTYEAVAGGGGGGGGDGGGGGGGSVTSDNPPDNTVTVSIWSHLTGPTWAKVGEVATWESVNIEKRFLQPGPWTLTVPLNEQSLRITKKNLLTFEFRGELTTGVIEVIGPAGTEQNGVTFTISGVDALNLLGDVPCYPIPGNGLGAQTVAGYTDAGPAATVLGRLISLNYPPWYSGGLYRAVMPTAPNPDLTTSVSLNERFSSLLQTVTELCDLAGLGINVGLVTHGSSTRADLTIGFFTPTDQSLRVRLSHRVGTLRTWSQADNVPTATRAIEGDGGKSVDRKFRMVTSDAAEAEWGRRRFVFVDTSDTFDAVVMDQRGLAELQNDAAQSSFDLEAVDAAGMRYGVHYTVGDTVTIELLTGVKKVDKLRAVVINVDTSGVTVQLRPGNPDAGDPMFAQAAIIRGLARRIRRLEQEK